MRERCRCGSVRRTSIARGPPSGTSRAVMSSTGTPSAHAASGPGRPSLWQRTSAGFVSTLLTIAS